MDMCSSGEFRNIRRPGWISKYIYIYGIYIDVSSESIGKSFQKQQQQQQNPSAASSEKVIINNCPMRSELGSVLVSLLIGGNQIMSTTCRGPSR